MPRTVRPIKILAYGDSPVVPSGFGTVMYNIFSRLGNTQDYSIDIIGINDRGAWKDPDLHPYHVYAAEIHREKDPFGRASFIDILRGGGLDLQPPWDIVFMFNDPFVLEAEIPYFKLGTIPAAKDIQKTHYTQLPPEMWFKTIGYFPVDSPLKPHWINGAIAQVDKPVLYTQYALNEFQKANDLLDAPHEINPQVIPHGNNFDHFYPLEKVVTQQFRRDFFKKSVREETFLVVAVGRNQVRKDLARTMKIFREFQKRRPDSFLYIHAQDQDAWGSLMEVGYQLGLKQGKDWNFPEDFAASKGFPHEILNGIYNSADCILSTTLGEGWGLPLTEAMATKTIVLAPNITSIPEIFNTQKIKKITDMETLVNQPIRGIPLLAGSTSSEWVNLGAKDLERFRPLTNVDDAVQKLLWIYDNQDKLQPIIDRAFDWIQQLNWDNVVQQWDKLFKQTFKELEIERKNPESTQQKRAKDSIPPQTK